MTIHIRYDADSDVTPGYVYMSRYGSEQPTLRDRPVGRCAQTPRPPRAVESEVRDELDLRGKRITWSATVDAHGEIDGWMGAVRC